MKVHLLVQKEGVSIAGADVKWFCKDYNIKPTQAILNYVKDEFIDVDFVTQHYGQDLILSGTDAFEVLSRFDPYQTEDLVIICSRLSDQRKYDPDKLQEYKNNPNFIFSVFHPTQHKIGGYTKEELFDRVYHKGRERNDYEANGWKHLAEKMIAEYAKENNIPQIDLTIAIYKHRHIPEDIAVELLKNKFSIEELEDYYYRNIDKFYTIDVTPFISSFPEVLVKYKERSEEIIDFLYSYTRNESDIMLCSPTSMTDSPLVLYNEERLISLDGKIFSETLSTKVTLFYLGSISRNQVEEVRACITDDLQETREKAWETIGLTIPIEIIIDNKLKGLLRLDKIDIYDYIQNIIDYSEYLKKLQEWLPSEFSRSRKGKSARKI